MDDFDDVVQEFLVESYENLDQLDRDLVALEKEPKSHERLASIFRTIHTIKGTSGFLAFTKLEQVTHVGESLLVRLRDGTQELDKPSADVLLRMVDTVRELLAQIEQNGAEGDLDVQDVIDAVTACITGGPAAAPAAPAAAPEVAAVVEAPATPEASDEEPEGEDAEHDEHDEPEHREEPSAPAAVNAPAPLVEAADEGGSKRSVADSSIRVDVNLLDALMRLVGELVLTRNQMIRAADAAGEPNLSRAAQRLNLITSELQESVMKTRMQPIKQLWSKLPRVVRDLSSACGREVELVMEGAETELDRSLLEAVKDPLTHLVRNAVDHGIEPPETRVANGKSREGTLTLRAYHEHGQVIVEVCDDGAGIHPDKVGATAVKRGVITQSQLESMDNDEILKLVFRPGFSTAAKVSNVSGRGVGMDVVRANIEAIGGAVDLKSVPGKGTTWRLNIPLTLAIVQALIVDSGDQRYAIPQMAVHELVYVDGQSGSVVEYVSGAPVYRLRGKLLPLVRLSEVLGGPSTGKGSDSEIYVAVLKAEGRQFGLVVDRVLNTEEVVVKPLASRFKDVGCYSGATILGEGQVSLILDVQSLARRAHLSSLERTVGAGQDEQVTASSNGDRLLITKVADRRIAIPLSMVTRLEDFPAKNVERVGTREVVQYRDQILPITRLSQLLGAWSETDREVISAIVYSEGGHSVALAVDSILDIVESDDVTRSNLDDDGLAGSAVVQQQVTELLDVRRAILAADPQFFNADYAGFDMAGA
ncbi:chemotaxis protein CheA [Actinosynnema pretiosum subsp. pretiosum]|uniref:histidine kinase n=2 Tax=Actinosynnema TaxID=40566 RepID=C6WJP0_ACTMD|nr:chemotaxis protein CheW [Actinosynnema mirum]ACU36265.1 CheA signal transduction histidine kinase [Actinosynnema mirum DSM 43827]AXX29717.1 Signal transduction histidine kinase CheA [Actinosynnema pretiosum subsp. pretiosum]QUF06063.1 chemotaxis protein CheA [Actinosynnema pretiosum subsp. pretiosum]